MLPACISALSARQHDPDSPLLIGHLQPDDKISQPKQVSWIDPQMRLDLGDQGTTDQTDQGTVL